MTVAPEATTADINTTDAATFAATFAASDEDVSRPRRSAMTARRVGRPWARPAALVVVVVVMWLIVLAIITVV